MLERFLKPHYVWRPRQAVLRLFRGISGSLPRSTIVTLPWGVPLRIDATEAIGQEIWHLGVHDLAVGETLWRLLEPGDLALDVGANLGQMTSLMALRTGPSGRVLSFEPHPDVFRQLVDNIDLFRRHAAADAFAVIEPFAVALGGAAGMAFLETTDHFIVNRGTARLVASPTPISVPVTTLDHVLKDGTAAVIKIDVEGGEVEVLAGGTNALRQGRIRNLICEGHVALARRLTGLLEDFGYRVFGLGWNLRGLILSGPAEPPSLPGFQTPNYLATLDPDRVIPRLQSAGWRTL